MTGKTAVVIGTGPIRIGQGIEFDYCCVHSAWALQEAGIESHHHQLQSGDGLDRLRHLRPPLLRAARRGERARTSSRTRPDRATSPRRHRPVRRADRNQPGRAALAAPACRSSAPARRRSTSPRTGGGSRASSSDLGIPQPPGAAVTHARRGDEDGADASATRCWCARPTCSAAARWRSSRTRPSSSRYLAHGAEAGAGKPGPHRQVPRWQGGRGRCDLRRRDGAHPRRSWSTSSAPACTPATRWRSTRRATCTEAEVDTIVDYTTRIGLGAGVRGLINIQYVIAAASAGEVRASTSSR